MLNDDTEDASDNTESVRIEAAAALRELAHTFISHELDEATVVTLCDWARRETAELNRMSSRSRLMLMQRLLDSTDTGAWRPGEGAGFEDRAVGGRANPTALVFDTWREGDVMVADLELGAAFEGAPGRAHGGDRRGGVR